MQRPSAKPPIYMFFGTYYEALVFCERVGLAASEWKFPQSPDDLRGLKDLIFVMGGTFPRSRRQQRMYEEAAIMQGAVFYNQNEFIGQRL